MRVRWPTEDDNIQAVGGGLPWGMIVVGVCDQESDEDGCVLEFASASIFPVLSGDDVILVADFSRGEGADFEELLVLDRSRGRYRMKAARWEPSRPGYDLPPAIALVKATPSLDRASIIPLSSAEDGRGEIFVLSEPEEHEGAGIDFIRPVYSFFESRKA